MTRKIAWAFALSLPIVFAFLMRSDHPLHAQSAVSTGVRLQILSATISPERRVVVTFRLTDDRGLPLDRAGVRTEGRVEITVILARINRGDRQYTAYTTRTQTGAVLGTVPQAWVDSGGTFTESPDGTLVYTSGTVLPENYDPTVTHTVGLSAVRDLTATLGKRFVANATFDFIPAGGEVSLIRDVVTTAACNQCHDQLQAHGGRYVTVKTCVLCHQPQTADPDTGNTVDFKVMIHKIHRGRDLPSVRAGTPYRFVGFMGRVFDFSTVGFPQDIRNCTTCHAAGATQADNHLTQPSRAACGSCHDNVNFATGENHLGIIQRDDRLCGRCHQPTSGEEFDLSVAGAHAIPFKSRQLPGVLFDIVGVTDTAPGRTPTVLFTIRDRSGRAIAPSAMTRLALVLGGPTQEYTWWVSEDARGATGPDAAGNYRYTFRTPLPADARGTYVVGIEGYRNITLDPGPAAPGDPANVVRDAGDNVVRYVAVTDAQPIPRRQIVDLRNCVKCHDSLRTHGNTRNNNIEYCVVCHNPTATDEARRPADQMPPESIDFKLLIHKIHRGEHLEREYTVYNFFRQPVPFNEVRFPASLKNCQLCHVPGTNVLPVRAALATITPRGFQNPTPPTSTACLGCHDSLSAEAHAFVNTAGSVETCIVCHGEGKPFAVSKVHALLVGEIR
jgi:OmcA/MtrC family decaheme c-type cytochrome